MTQFACDLYALTPEQRHRRVELLQQLMQDVQQMIEEPDGLTWLFEPLDERVWKLCEFVMLERLCCPFLELTVAFSPFSGPLRLTLRGESGVKTFLLQELNL